MSFNQNLYTYSKSLLLSVLIVRFSLLAACSDEDANPVDDNLLGLPQVITELYPDDSNTGELKGKFTYDGARLLEIYYNATQKKVFTYTGDFITTVEHYQNSVVRFEHNYTYSDGKLTLYENNDLLTGNNDVVTYTHHEDGTITYLHVSNLGGTLNWQKDGILTFENGNLIEDVAEFSFSNVTDEYNIIINLIEYDNKVNPFKNILGYSSLLNLKGTIGNENIITDYTYTSSYKNEVQYAEAITGKEYEFTYDQKNRTTQIDRFSNEDIGGDILYLDRIFKIEY
jgi:outer membrane lipoprotein-sorting protein